MEVFNITEIPIKKSANSPIPPVEVIGSFSNVLITTTSDPPNGPKAKPAIIAGKLENWISKKLGNKKGSGNLIKYNAKDNELNNATFTMNDVVRFLI